MVQPGVALAVAAGVTNSDGIRRRLRGLREVQEIDHYCTFKSVMFITQGVK